VPVIAVGKIGDPVLANRILEEGKADFIAMGRPLLVDPQLPNKAREGRFEDIRRCIYCNNCWSRVQEQKYKQVHCTVNPAVGREQEFMLTPVQSPKKVMVIGGGLAGMTAAIVLAQRGHKVSLCERSERLGGQWNIASQQKPKDKIYPTLTEYMVREIEQAGIKVALNTEVTAKSAREQKPDVVIVATGAVPKTLDVKGATGKNVIQANDVIAGKARVGKTVVMVGGRLVGMEVAISLAEDSKRVSVVTLHRLGENGRELDRNIYRTLRDRLIDLGVFIYPDSPVVEIRDNGVYVAHNRELLFLKADTIVLAVGTVSNDKLARELADFVPQLYQIGDCVKPRDALDAVREGAEVGRQI